MPEKIIRRRSAGTARATKALKTLGFSVRPDLAPVELRALARVAQDSSRFRSG
jgi:hypothetical protein